jgi:diadenosine tetraphosphate (Ap4A) HIT family hydrolase
MNAYRGSSGPNSPVNPNPNVNTASNAAAPAASSAAWPTGNLSGADPREAVFTPPSIMAMMRAIVCLLALLALSLGIVPSAARADVSQCACDWSNPEAMKARNCSLSNEARKQPEDVEFFLLKDINPRKPGRWLALPRKPGIGSHDLHELTKEERTSLWRYTMAEADKLFPGRTWGLAYNGAKVRTQCHLHIHIGKWVPAAHTSGFRLVKRVEDLPAPPDSGVLLYPVEGGFMVLTGEQIMETALVR